MTEDNENIAFYIVQELIQIRQQISSEGRLSKFDDNCGG